MDTIKNATQEVEIKNCAESFVYFCEKYIKVHHPLRGLVPLTLHNYQKRYAEFLDSNRFVIAKKFRQGGFTTVTLAWLLWRFLFKLDERNMVMSKTDREAVNCGWIVRHMLRELPDFLQPNLSKQNDHTLECDELNNRLTFHTPEAACGRALDHLFIDEPAFIKDMHQHWKAMYPTLSTGGHCIAVSTPNGKYGWFYDIYNLAETGRNEFKVFRSQYWEHPDYSDDEWASRMKGNLGARGWRQEVLQEFLDPDNRNPQQKFEDALHYFDEVTAAEEFVEGLKSECKTNRVADRDRVAQRKKEEKWDLFHNAKSGELIWELDEPYKEAKKAPEVNLDDGERYRPTAHTFKPLTPEEKTKILDEFKSWSKDVGQAQFDRFSLKSSKDMAQFWEDLSELSPEYEEEAQRWRRHVDRMDRQQREIEERVNEYMDPDLLALAGVISSAAAKAMPREPYARPDRVILSEAQSKFKNLQLCFDQGRLCVNDCPTTIMEDDLRDLYNGTFALQSYREAIDASVKVIVDKLSPLFERAGADNGEVASKTP